MGNSNHTNILLALVAGIVGALLYYASTHSTYEDKHGREAGQKKCWIAAGLFGGAVMIFVALIY